MANLRVFPSPEDMAVAFALKIKQLADDIVPVKGLPWRHKRIALSGGSTPQRAYEFLAKEDFDQSKIDWYMVDERYVPIEDERSNKAMIRRALGDRFELNGMYQPGGMEDAANAYNQLLRRDVDKFDLVVLGMGEDGHTASIFPNRHPEVPLNEFCVASKAPVVCEDRITLTPRAICWARETLFMVTGESKAKILREVLKGKLDTIRLPAQYVHHHSINCHWWVDEQAASLL